MTIKIKITIMKGKLKRKIIEQRKKTKKEIKQKMEILKVSKIKIVLF